MIGPPGVWLMIPTPSDALITNVPRGDAVAVGDAVGGTVVVGDSVEVAVPVGDGVTGVAVRGAGVEVAVAGGVVGVADAVKVGGRTVGVGEGTVGVAGCTVGVLEDVVGTRVGMVGVEVGVATGVGATPELPPHAQRTASDAMSQKRVCDHERISRTSHTRDAWFQRGCWFAASCGRLVAACWRFFPSAYCKGCR